MKDERNTLFGISALPSLMAVSQREANGRVGGKQQDAWEEGQTTAPASDRKAMVCPLPLHARRCTGKHGCTCAKSSSVNRHRREGCGSPEAEPRVLSEERILLPVSGSISTPRSCSSVVTREEARALAAARG